MANQCCNCKRKLGFFDDTTMITKAAPDYVLCADCNAVMLNMRSADPEKYADMEARFQPLLSNPGTPAAVRNHFNELRAENAKARQDKEARLAREAEEIRKQAEEKRQQQEAARQMAAFREGMLVVTTDQVEGKQIKQYLDVVTGTSIYLVGGLIGGGLANQEGLFGPAFAQAKQHMIEKATTLGANAIVGVSTNVLSPGGLNNIIVVVTGTAVYVEDK